MTRNEIARALEEARDLIRAKAWTLVRRPGAAWVDVEDAVQELTLRLLSRLPGYQPELLPLRAYVRMILRRGISNWVRAATADKRVAVRTLLPSEDLDALSSPPERRGDQDLTSLSQDLQVLLGLLDRDDQQMVQAVLEQGSLFEAARTLGISPQTVLARLRCLQELARDLGLEDYLADFSRVGDWTG